jgi:predicted transcriptional regulator
LTLGGALRSERRSISMGKTIGQNLSRRERQIMDVVYKLGKVTAADVIENIPSPPTNAAVRRMLAILEEKGYLRHAVDGQRYIYSPTVDREKASRSALEHLTDTYFDGSPVQTVATLLDISASRLSDEELEELKKLIDSARKEGR